MANKNSFNATQWDIVKDAPYYVQSAINAAEGRMGLMEVKREGKALKNYLAEYKGNNPLIKAVIAEDGNTLAGRSNSAEKIADILGDIADAVASKTDDAEYDEFMDFLLGAGTAIADATSEKLIKKGDDNISDEEAEALDLIAAALKSTDEDKLARSRAAAAARRAELKKRQDAAAKVAADKKKAAEAKKALEEAQAKLKAAEEAEAKRKAAAERQAAARERRRKRLAEKAAKERAEAAKAAAVEAAAAAEAAKKYVVQPGDSLWKIAEATLGNGKRYMEIAELNNIKNPSVIFPGTELEIPEK